MKLRKLIYKQMLLIFYVMLTKVLERDGIPLYGKKKSTFESCNIFSSQTFIVSILLIDGAITIAVKEVHRRADV